MEYVKIDEVVAEAKSVISTADEQDEILMRQWVWRGLQDVGIAQDEIQVCTIYPKNFLAKKPADCRAILDIALYDSEGCQIKHVFRTGKKRLYPIAANAPAVVSDDEVNPLWVDVSEDRTNLILGSNATTVASVGIRYFSYPLDVDGLPMIRQDEVMALVYFCRFMWSLRKNDNRSEIEQNRNMWLLESDRARARKKLINNEQLKTITAVWRSLIPNTRDKF
jgi:hypothetical protein